MTRAEARAQADALLVAHGMLESKRAARLALIERRDGTVGPVLSFEHVRPRKARIVRPPAASKPVEPTRAERNAARLVHETESAKAQNEQRARIVRAWNGLAYRPGFAG